MTSARHRVPVIGLVGGIGSGKSTLSRGLQKACHVAIVEGDAAGHLVLKEEPVKRELRRVFGDGVFDATGEVDRRRMSQLVFGPGSTPQANRAALEAIVHPRITKRLIAEIAAARSQPGIDLIVLDAALLLEAGWRKLCDHVVFVEATEQQRFERVAESRGWSLAQFQAREQSQFPLERKRMEADDVVDNSQSGAHALAQLEAIVSCLKSQTPS